MILVLTLPSNRMSIRFAGCGLSTSIEAEVLGVRCCGAFSCGLTQYHNLPMSGCPSKVKAKYSSYHITINTSCQLSSTVVEVS